MNIERIRNIVITVSLSVFVSLPGMAAEIITEQDLTEEVIKIEQLIRLTDNAIFLFDTSSSMGEKYQDTGKSRLALVESEIKKRNAYIPELGYKFGLYVYTPWNPLYELQTYDTGSVAAALDALPKKSSGPTRLARALDKLAPILRSTTGKTVVFLFTDGQFTGKRRPSTIARRLAAEHGVCFYVISTASEERNKLIVERVASINECSRVIPFSYFLERPEYTTGALYEVRASETIITRSDTRIVGLEIDPMHFGFDSVALDDTTRTELDEVADFLAKNAGSYVVINGYTDTSGPKEYNLNLSRRRTESATAYLREKRGISGNRIVRYWYGPLNPVASNDTREGRKQNRRLEMAVGGL